MSTFLSILPIIIALVLYFTGIPIAYALFAAALTYFGFIDTTTVPYLLMQKFITSTQSFPFLAIPFFIMCGSIMNYGGISARLMDFADALTGHLPGGLAQINVLLSMLMGGCSGSANADAAMECKLLVPEMEKRGYGKGFSAAITAASSCVTPIIPPGINLIVYGLIAGASVGQLFAAGYIPGLLMAVTLMIAVAIISKKRGAHYPRPAHGADREGRRDRSGALRHCVQRQYHDRRPDPAVRLYDVHVCVDHGLQDAGVYQGMCAVYHRAAPCAAAADVHSGHHDADTESHLLRETTA